MLFCGKASELTRADRSSQELSLVDRVGLAGSFGAVIQGWTPTCSTSSCRGAVGLPARLGAAGYLGELFFHCQVARNNTVNEDGHPSTGEPADVAGHQGEGGQRLAVNRPAGSIPACLMPLTPTLAYGGLTKGFPTGSRGLASVSVGMPASAF